MASKAFLFLLAIALVPFWLFSQKKAGDKSNGKKYAFITMPMFTESIPAPTMERALKNAMGVFLTGRLRVAESLQVTWCKVTATENLHTENWRLPGKTPDGRITPDASVPVDIKYADVTWDAEFTFTKDISIWHLWESESMFDIRLLSFFQENLEPQFKAILLKSIYNDHATLTFKAGQKFKLVGIHSRMIGPASDQTWTCYLLRDNDKHNHIAAAIFNLKKATTLDAKSISVDYVIKNAAAPAIHFDVYRSHVSEIADLNNITENDELVKLGQTDITDVDKLTPAEHNNVDLLLGIDLPPDTRMPYIVAVATFNNQKQQIYFKKWLLGALVHGFDLTAQYNFFGTPSWENTLASDLKTKDYYDEVIAFNWEKSCAVAAEGMTQIAGDNLFKQIDNYLTERSVAHLGDVVDIHFIGHSRGTVVVSRVLIDIQQINSSDFLGSYINVTLLDPHPANNADGNVVSTNFTGAISLIANKAYDDYITFQNKAKDPRIIIPDIASLGKINIFFEKSEAKNFSYTSPENRINLWGEGGSENLIINNSNVGIDWHELTDKTYKEFDGGPTILIGHTEVHEYYKLKVVDAGNLP